MIDSNLWQAKQPRVDWLWISLLQPGRAHPPKLGQITEAFATLIGAAPMDDQMRVCATVSCFIAMSLTCPGLASANSNAYKTNVGATSVPPNLEWKGGGTGTSIFLATSNGAGEAVACTRKIHTVYGSLYGIAAELPFFINASSGVPGYPHLVDTLLTDSYTVSISVEWPIKQGFTGLSPRINLPFKSKPTYTYTGTAAGGAGPAFATTDKVLFANATAGFPAPFIAIPSKSPFMTITCYQDLNGDATAANTMPNNLELDSYNAVLYESNYQATAEHFASLYGSISAYTTTSASVATLANAPGNFFGIAPLALMVDVQPQVSSWLLLGDCIPFGNNDGSPANISEDANGNVGVYQKYMQANGHNYINFARGSTSYLNSTSTAIRFQLQAAAQLAPNGIVGGMGHNDGPDETFAQIKSNAANYFNLWHTYLPNVPVVAGTITPQSVYAPNAYPTNTNQTPNKSWISGGSIFQYNAWVRTGGDGLFRNYIDFDLATSYGGIGTALWPQATSSTTLAAATTTTSPTITTSSAISPFCSPTINPNFYLQIDNEQLVAAPLSGDTYKVVKRGVFGTAAAAHVAHATATLIYQTSTDDTHPDSCGVAYILSNLAGMPDPLAP